MIPLIPRAGARRAANFSALFFSAALALLLPLLATSGAVAAPESVETESRLIEGFRRAEPEATLFGALEWVGGFELISADDRLAALSGLAVLGDTGRLLAVSDTGFVFETGIARDAAGRPTGWESTRVAELLDAAGESYRSKSDVDAEAIDVRVGADGALELVLALEGAHRIEVRPYTEADMQGLPTPVSLPDAVSRLGGNEGLEAMAVAPAGTPLAGHIVALAERDVDPDADIPGWIVGPQGGAFRLRRDGAYAVTDAAFLPNGDLLVLERVFSLRDLLGMRIRRIAAVDLVPGRTVDAATIVEADLSYEVDNMEGIAAWTRPDGEIAVALLSDDNEMFLQRTIYLEFRLVVDRLSPVPRPRPEVE